MFVKTNVMDIVVNASDSDKETFVKIFVIVAVVLLFFGILGFSAGKKKNAELYGDFETGENIRAKSKIVSKRTAPNPINPNVMINFVVFELDAGERVELAIKDSNEFGIMVEGDEGELEYNGKKFVAFRRTA